jgi:hypothetical protein
MSPQKLTLPKPIEAKKLKLKGTDGKDSKKNKDDNINELKNLLKTSGSR